MANSEIDVFRVENFLTRSICTQIVDEMRRGSGTPAIVSGGGKAVNPLVRNVLAVDVRAETIDKVTEALLAVVPEVDKHFGVTLSEIEEPQFLRYGAGDHFVAHQDGNTPLIYDDTLARKVSVVVFLNEQRGGGYSGGSLVLHGTYPNWEYRQDITAGAGTLVAFRSETTHEVQPVTNGERLTIVSWFRE